jgi:hypothetical protein
MGEVEAADPRQRAVQLDGEARAVVLHDGEFFFEVADLSTESGLSDSKFLSRFGEIQNFAHRREISEMPEFHTATIPEKHRYARNKVLAAAQATG